jgi:oxygen-dependent protoporphyrinogen oxidase
MSLRSVPINGKVAVLGAGISGLSFSYFLHKLRPDVSIEIFERKLEVGGWIKTQRLATPNGEIVMEKGPRTLRGVSSGTLLIVDMLKNLKLENEVQVLSKSSVANKKYLLNQDKKLIQVPDGIFSVGRFLAESGLMEMRFFWGILKEPFVKKRGDKVESGDESVKSTDKLVQSTDESIESFFLRRFGNKILTSKVLSAILHGVYAGDVAKLSVNSILPQLPQMEKESGSIVRSVMNKVFTKRAPLKLPSELEYYEATISPQAHFADLSKDLKKYPMMKLASGLQKFPLELAKFLKSTGKVKIHTDVVLLTVDVSGEIVLDTGVYKFDHIHSTIPAFELAKVLRGSQDISNLLDTVKYADIFLVNVYSPSGKLIPQGKNGFGFLVPKHEISSNPDCLLGVIYDSDVEKHVSSLFSTETNKLQGKPYHKITLMMGGHYYNDMSTPSASVNLKIVKKVLQEHCGMDASTNLIIRDEASMSEKLLKMGENDIVISYNYHEKCIPQYNVGYGETKDKMGKLLEVQPKISLGGMAFGLGVGVPDCVVDGLKGAIAISDLK